MLHEQQPAFWASVRQSPLAQHVEALQTLTRETLTDPNQGDFRRWMTAFDQLPKVQSLQVDLQQAISIQGELQTDACERLRDVLMQLHPWRKGPFDVLGVHIDAEWRSQLKWQRVLSSGLDLHNKIVMDIGCGNGYYLLRMAGLGPRVIMGVEPGLLQNIQFHAINRYAGTAAGVLPLRFEQLPDLGAHFDVVFSMGVLYHRKSPIEHLERIKSFLRPGGQLLLETLIVEGDVDTALLPPGRYARMGNVWYLPSQPQLERLLQRLGFLDVRCVDESQTDFNEQRSTEWMRFHSLRNFIDADSGLTVEGHPRPRRSLTIATAP